ncbi:small integral membrane protein 20 [Anguilla rostrata]|uniref:small integral membrane protein 20 n=1 Tax=Anguilla rostrata TaxID=7938 RepID=UPI0030D3F7DC
MIRKMSRNRRTTLIFAGFVTAVAAAFYPIFFHPMTHVHEYKQVQTTNRAGINQADVQPVGVKVWSDPFKSK